jgi:vanillate O-demethylase monooxygenase subunit
MVTLQQAWHPVASTASLTDAPLAATLLGVPLVVWRDSGGVAHANSDVCVHRGTALSGGCVRGDSIACPYHGWQYAADGHCTLIPQLEQPTRVPAKAKIGAYSCKEVNGLVWVALESAAFDIPTIAEFTNPDWRFVECGPYEWNTDASRQLENFTDFGHFPWVHPGLLGDPSRLVVPDYEVSVSGNVVSYDIVRPEAPNSEDFPIFANTDKTTPMRQSHYAIYAPYTLLLRLGWGGNEGMVYFFVSQPINPEHSRGFLQIGRNYNLDQPDSVLREFEDVIFAQDKVIVESQRPKVVPFAPTAELHMKFDAVALNYRKVMVANGFDQ